MSPSLRLVEVTEWQRCCVIDSGCVTWRHTKYMVKQDAHACSRAFPPPPPMYALSFIAQQQNRYRISSNLSDTSNYPGHSIWKITTDTPVLYYH